MNYETIDKFLLKNIFIFTKKMNYFLILKTMAFRLFLI